MKFEKNLSNNSFIYVDWELKGNLTNLIFDKLNNEQYYKKEINTSFYLPLKSTISIFIPRYENDICTGCYIFNTFTAFINSSKNQQIKIEINENTKVSYNANNICTIENIKINNKYQTFDINQFNFSNNNDNINIDIQYRNDLDGFYIILTGECNEKNSWIEVSCPQSIQVTYYEDEN